MNNNLSTIVAACSNILQEYPVASQARDYIKSRINDDIQKQFEFGYFPSYEQLDSLFALVSKEQLIESNLLYQNIDSYSCPMINHNLVMPYKDVYGNIIAIVGRTLIGEEERARKGISKYKNTSFKKSKHLFGLYESKHNIIKHKYVYVVEGQFDVIKAHVNGINNVVALGSSNMSMEQFALLLRYTNNIKLLLDRDEAGDSGRARILEKFAKYTNISNSYLPQGYKDLDEFLSDNPINFKDFNNALSDKP